MPTTDIEGLGCVTILYNGQHLPCQNGGTPGRFACHCPSSFTGRYCEEETNPFCQTADWIEADKQEQLKDVSSSEIPMKIVRDYGLGIKAVMDLSCFLQSRDKKFKAMILNFLTVDATGENFDFPLKKQFDGYVLDTRGIKIDSVTLAKKMVPISDRAYNNATFLVPAQIDDKRVFYEEGGEGSVSSLKEKLSIGYRHMARDFGRVAFGGDVITDNLHTHFGSHVRAKYFLYSTRYVLLGKKKYLIKTKVYKDDVVLSFIEPESKSWELDQCWTRVKPLDDYHKFTDVLKEIVLQGRDVRLVFNGTVSSDVLVVTLTKNDVIATLAYYFHPFDAVSPLDENSTVIYSHLSRSKVLSECEVKFRGNHVYDQRSFHYTMSVEWFASTRPSKKVFVVGSDGRAVSGSLEDVLAAAIGGRNIRVCVAIQGEVGQPGITVCSGGRQLWVNTISGSDSYVTLQTPGMLDNEVRQDGSFAGVTDPDCRQNVWLVSTKGWVKAVTFTMGVDVNEGSSLKVDTISWFVEE